MLIGPKYKICKRLGASVFEKCQTQKFQLAEARAPRKIRSKRGGSDYGQQLIEKQKARFTYGLTETQFSRYVREAMSARGKDSSAGLLSRLESRLDNAVYRAGFVKTRRAPACFSRACNRQRPPGQYTVLRGGRGRHNFNTRGQPRQRVVCKPRRRGA